MDFNLSPEHLLIRKMMAEFTENEVKPIAAETDAKTLYPRENIEKLFDLGVMGMCIPKEYGGQGADPLASAICIEELSKQCASTGDIVATHNGLCCDPILTHGTEEQKAKYLPMLSTGHKVGAFALTEPNAGSDASKGQTEAKLVGRPLCDERLQDLHHQRLCGRRVRGLRHDRQVQGHQGHLRLHRGVLLPRLLRGQARGEDGPARLSHG